MDFTFVMFGFITVVVIVAWLTSIFVGRGPSGPSH